MKKLRTIALGIGILLTVAGIANAQVYSGGPCYATLPLGTWNMNGNGFTGTLYIAAINAAGEMTGTMTLTGGGVDQIRGFWTASACKITFLRVDGNTFNPANALSVQAYTGYAYPALTTNPNGQKRLAGFFETFAPLTGGSAARHVFGWDAYRY